jgi:hypothetical protein
MFCLLLGQLCRAYLPGKYGNVNVLTVVTLKLLSPYVLDMWSLSTYIDYSNCREGIFFPC